MLSHSPGARCLAIKCRGHLTGGPGKRENPGLGKGIGWAENKVEKAHGEPQGKRWLGHPSWKEGVTGPSTPWR